ncbi:MAG: DNA-3-methyladenine glycosylase I, partial [Pseudomonadales bacterium]|nr:DNA-3-methyladenine glycosylase I [Pseudomonadales bacterium]NIX08382.1 DNA-3-methyladenine glycosylase I [Pseudomonadales bacterium]
VIQGLRDSHGGFYQWIEQQHPLPKEAWVKRFRKTFKFMGPEIVGEFLMSTGVLP